MAERTAGTASPSPTRKTWAETPSPRWPWQRTLRGASSSPPGQPTRPRATRPWSPRPSRPSRPSRAGAPYWALPAATQRWPISAGKPMPFDQFAVALEQIQAYLRGDAVDCDGFPSRISGWRQRRCQGAMSVAATGPRVIRWRHASPSAITFSVGADPERLAGQSAGPHAPRTELVCRRCRWAPTSTPSRTRTCRSPARPGPRPAGRLRPLLVDGRGRPGFAGAGADRSVTEQLASQLRHARPRRQRCAPREHAEPTSSWTASASSVLRSTSPSVCAS